MAVCASTAGIDMTQEALKLALEALEQLVARFDCEKFTSICELEPAKDAITAIKEALANHIEDNLVMVKKDDAWRNQLTRAQRNELKQIEDGTWEADRNG